MATMSTLPGRLLAAMVALSVALRAQGETDVSGMEEALRLLGAQMEDVEARMKAHLESMLTDHMADLRAELEAMQRANKAHFHDEMESMLKDIKDELRDYAQAPQLFRRSRSSACAPCHLPAARSVPPTLASASARSVSPVPERALHEAAARGDAQALHALLSSGAEVDARDAQGDTALHAAARAGHEETLSALLRFGADPCARGRRLRSPLHSAAAHGHVRAAERLLAAGAQIDARDASGATPLALATPSEMFHFLLLQNASVDYVDAQGDTPLLSAMRRQQWRWASNLTEHGASATARGRDGVSPLLLAARAGRSDLLQAMLRCGAASHAAEMQRALEEAGDGAVVWALAQAVPEMVAGAAGKAALRRAARDNRLGALEALLQAGADPGERDEESTTALHIAAQLGHDKCVSSLLRLYEESDAKQSDIRRTLEVTNSPNFVLIVGEEAPQLLREQVGIEAFKRVSKYASCNSLDALFVLGGKQMPKHSTGQSMLDLAISAENSNCIGRILQMENNAAVQKSTARYILSVTNSSNVAQVVASAMRDVIRGPIGGEALIQAAEEGRCDVLKVLLVAGVSANQNTSSGKTALDIALEKGHQPCVGLLREHGAHLLNKIKMESDFTKAAGRCRLLEMVELLAAGVNLNAVDGSGFTALMRAAESDCFAAVALLLLRGADKNAAVPGFFGGTALMAAARKGHYEVVRALMSAGADINAKDITGESALFMSARWGHPRVVHALLTAGADVTATYAGKTALEWAVEENHSEAELILRQHSA